MSPFCQKAKKNSVSVRASYLSVSGFDFQAQHLVGWDGLSTTHRPLSACGSVGLEGNPGFFHENPSKKNDAHSPFFLAIRREDAYKGIAKEAYLPSPCPPKWAWRMHNGQPSGTAGWSCCVGGQPSRTGLADLQAAFNAPPW